MVDQLNFFSRGKLGVQAQVGGVGGTGKDLTDNVNSMAATLSLGRLLHNLSLTLLIQKSLFAVVNPPVFDDSSSR